MDTGYYRIDILISQETSIHELTEDGKTQLFWGKFTNSLYNQESDCREVSSILLEIIIDLPIDFPINNIISLSSTDRKHHDPIICEM